VSSQKTLSEIAGTPESFGDLLRTVCHQSLWICIGYLLTGITSEILRKCDVHAGITLQNFLDGMAIAFMRVTGLIDFYVNATAGGVLTPFLNRCFLAVLTMFLILVQTFILGSAFSALFLFIERKLDARHETTSQQPPIRH
jgi:hypothetical protein